MTARVLIVDDDPVVRRSLSVVLTRAGYGVTTANDALPAIALADEFDAVVADYNMPTATGAEVVRHFKALFGDQVFCVVLTGDDDDTLSSRCRDAGADVVLVKPTMPSALRRCLEDGLDALRAAA